MTKLEGQYTETIKVNLLCDMNLIFNNLLIIIY